MSKPKIALSTCCCSQRHIDGYEMIKEMVDFGFEYIDLTHRVRISFIPGLLRVVDEKLMKIYSIHNYCPLPTDISHAAPNLYQPFFPERKERQLWVHQTSRTIDFTSCVGADQIDAHCGITSFFWTDPERTIHRLRAGRDSITINSNERYRRLVEKYIVKARRKSVVVMDRVRQCLEAVIPLAKEKVSSSELKIGRVLWQHHSMKTTWI